MGPENTLILIDGKPVTSRNSIRLGWRGERDTRGDTGWVPPEMIERIEVIRGPAAALRQRRGRRRGEHHHQKIRRPVARLLEHLPERA
jgi:hypothetical protein